jgi:hypothetical protein
MTMTTIERLQEWYAQQCNEGWEHRYGVRIDSCDNPGWWVKIDVVGTDLANEPFTPINLGVDAAGHPTEPEWLVCTVKDKVFDGSGDAGKLETILKLFLDWKDKLRTRACT